MPLRTHLPSFRELVSGVPGPESTWLRTTLPGPRGSTEENEPDFPHAGHTRPGLPIDPHASVATLSCLPQAGSPLAGPATPSLSEYGRSTTDASVDEHPDDMSALYLYANEIPSREPLRSNNAFSPYARADKPSVEWNQPSRVYEPPSNAYHGHTMSQPPSPSSSHYTNSSQVGRLHPVDPSSWDAVDEDDTDVTDDVDISAYPECRSASDELHLSTRSTQMAFRNTQGQGSGRRKKEWYKTPLDNEPTPFGLDEHSFSLLKNRLWQPYAPLPPTVICRFNGCGRSVSTEERRMRAHLIDRHDIVPRGGSVQCRWTAVGGEECGTRTASRNYRVHILDKHLQANAGRCVVCNKNMLNGAGMKRHLKQCLRNRTIDDMWQTFGVRIVDAIVGGSGKGHYRYMPPV
ncbi:hypothetical protein PENSPDRAFT_749278 [Peniophora sp. CONT]|nr:hypothetical protein PENSPDRAFT_749278 [Peniophora sp. CONT]